jgi:hypothetical protein
METARVDRRVMGDGGESREFFFTNGHSYILCEQATRRISRLSACVVTLGQTGCLVENSDKESGNTGERNWLDQCNPFATQSEQKAEIGG